jgi:two-component system cell cycle sensor histidine kinase/response regulator CckA
MAKEHNTNPEPGVTGEASELTVLLADDDAAIRRLAGQVLRSSGYTVLEAADGVEALKVTEQHPEPITCF